MTDREARAAEIIAGNKYLTMATVAADGSPWATPVYYTPDGHTHFYWASSPGSRHSTNIAVNPAVSLVIFDSTVNFGQAEAVYVTARAAIVPDDELAACAKLYAARFPELREYTAKELSPPADLRLYRATTTEAWTLMRGRDPENTTGLDARHPIWRQG
jgi:nitroimidazol reductase NimA-like FMN-containing flavoprotein (pyridoxamine 5'-phosphate oxidase superfamily)